MDKKAAAESKRLYEDIVGVIKHSDNKNYDKVSDEVRQAIAALKALGEQGYVEAQCTLGEYFSMGYCVEMDKAKAAFWYEEAAKNGSIQAAGALLDLYRFCRPEHISAEQTEALARQWHKIWFSMLQAKAEKGGEEEAEALMNLYIDDPPDDLEEEQARGLARKWYEAWIALLKDKADKGSARAKKKLADVLYSGDGVPAEMLDEFSDEEDDRDLDQSVELYEQLAAQGDGEAGFSLGCAYDYFEAPEEAMKKSFAYFMKAAQLGYAQAYVCLGSAYFHGKGVERDWTKAREMYQIGADMGNPGAKRALADCCKRGAGGEKDFQKALELYLDAAKAHDEYALYALGDMYMKGLGVAADLQKAYDYFRKAARYGSRAAENALNSKKFRDFKK